jgi:hypothetical protein
LTAKLSHQDDRQQQLPLEALAPRVEMPQLVLRVVELQRDREWHDLVALGDLLFSLTPGDEFVWLQ